MKILFVMYDNESPRNHLPVGSCYVAGYLKQHGYDDISYYSQDVYHHPEEHLTAFLDVNDFDVVGIGFVAGYYQHAKALKICDAINRSKHRPFVVLGGHGPSPIPEFYLQATKADAVVIGEGELPFLHLLQALDSRTPLSTVKGIAYREGDQITINEREAPIADLDDIPDPYYDPLPMEYYLNAKFYNMWPTDRVINVVSSRGCNYRCNFCMRLEKGMRLRSAERVAEEIKRYQTDYGVTYVVFLDELFMYNDQRVVDLTEAFHKARLKFRYFCTGRLNTVNREMLRLLKRSGCAYVDYGIEQFDNDALRAMDKRLTEEQITRGIELTQSEGFPIVFDLIFGNLGDTRETMRKTLDFFHRYNDYGQFRTIRPVTPYPGTKLYDHAIANGMLKGPADFYDKHVNLELPTVNFTKLPDDEYVDLLFQANQEIAQDYYGHLSQNAVEAFRRVYYCKDVDFRGVRH